jgi:hypothetical protein
LTLRRCVVLFNSQATQRRDANRQPPTGKTIVTTATNLLAPTTGLILAGWIANTILTNLPTFAF